MAVNKVEYYGKVLLDLTEDSVTPGTLAKGATAHDASGRKITGTMQPADEVLETVTVHDTLRWDGNTEGKAVFDMTGDGSYTYYPVSENVITLEDLQNGLILESSDVTGVAYEEIKLTDFAKMTNKVIASRSVSSVLFVLEDNAPLYSGTIPKKGIYFLHSAEYGYASKIRIPGYDGFNTELRVAKEEYIPDTHIQPTGSLEITENGDYDVTEKAGVVVAIPAPALQEKTVTPTTAQQTVAPDTGYDGLSKVTVNAMPTATQATPSIEVSSAGLITASATQSAGYVAAGTKSATKQLTVQAAQTITPGTANKTIASGRYLTGTQTIKGDSNLVAGNIKKGVSIFGVTGTYESVGLCTVALTNNTGEALNVVYNAFTNGAVSCVAESVAAGATKTIANVVKNSILTVSATSATSELQISGNSNCSVKRSNTHTVIFEVGTGSSSAVSLTVSVPPKYTNLIPTATVVNGTAIYNGTGYKDGYRISSAISTSAASGYVTTGVMPYMERADGTRPTIYIKGVTLETNVSNCRWSGLPYLVNATASNCIQLNGNASAAANQFGTYFTIETLGTNYYKLTPIESAFDAWSGSPIGRMMMSMKGSGANMIVTLDEPIE